MLTLPPLLWAGNAVVARMSVGPVSPLLLNAARWLLACIILLPLGRRVLRPTSGLRMHWRYFASLGLLGVGSFNALQYLALQTSTPINVTLIASSMPVWMLAVGALRYGNNLTPVFAALLSAALLGDPPRWFHGLAFALIVAGILVSSRGAAGRGLASSE